jgi:hypothetical protein
MDYVMRGILGVLTYIDNLLVHNKGHEDHLRMVEEVLLRLRKYGLKLNADKSIFGATTVQYLGYTRRSLIRLNSWIRSSSSPSRPRFRQCGEKEGSREAQKRP